MTTIVTRAGKGSPLTWDEADANFTNLQSKADQTITVLDYGAEGDGIADDTLAVYNAFSTSSNVVVDGGNKTYKVNQSLTITTENIKIQNLTLDFTDTPTTADSLLQFQGSLGDSSLITTDVTNGDITILVEDTSIFEEGAYAFISCSKINTPYYSPLKLGQMIKILSIDSENQITLTEPILYDFAIADDTTVSSLNLKNNISFDNVKFIGSNGSFYDSILGFYFCSNIKINNCVFEDSGYASCLISKTINFNADKCIIRSKYLQPDTKGFNIIDGSYQSTINNCIFNNQYRSISGGFVENDGIILHLNILNNVFTGCTYSGIHLGSFSDFISIQNNTIEASSDTTNLYGGIYFEGLTCNIKSNNIIGAFLEGIYHSQSMVVGSCTSTIVDNTISNTKSLVGTSNGIFVSSFGGSNIGTSVPISGIIISNNIINSPVDFSIYVSAFSANIDNISILGNIAFIDSTSISCFVYAADSFVIKNVSISDNSFKTSSTNVLNIEGTTIQNISNVTITGNKLIGGTKAIQLKNVGRVSEKANICVGTTSKYNIQTGVSDCYLDREQLPIYTHNTSSSFTVLDDYMYMIVDWAGTVTITLPSVSTHKGRIIYIKTIQAQLVNSDASNVVPMAGGSPGNAILSAVDGQWVQLYCDGTNWIGLAA